MTTTVSSKPTHTNAFVTDTSDTVWSKNSSTGVYSQSFALPNYGSTANTKVVKVQAEDCLAKYASVPGNTNCHTQTYTINVNRKKSNGTTVKETTKSSNNLLKSLLVSDGTLSPKFEIWYLISSNLSADQSTFDSNGLVLVASSHSIVGGSSRNTCS